MVYSFLTNCLSFCVYAGVTAVGMDMVVPVSRMVTRMKEDIDLISVMERASTSGMMAAFMTESSWKTSVTERENSPGPTAQSTLAISSTVSEKVLANTFLQMEDSMKDRGRYVFYLDFCF